MICLSLLVLCSASYSDYKSREVSDTHWIILGGIGIIGNVSLFFISGSIVPGTVFLVSGSLFLASILGCFGKADWVCELVALFISVLTVLVHPGNKLLLVCSAAVLFGGVYHLFYVLGIVRGGADAKCLMCMGFVLPSYPVPVLGSSANIPDIVALVIGPSFSVMFMASLISVAGCGIYCILKNIGSNADLRSCFYTYSVPLATVENHHVWSAEKPSCSSGTSRKGIDISDISQIAEQLRMEGRKTMKVTPMVPFIIPLTAGFVCLVLFGSPLFIL